MQSWEWTKCRVKKRNPKATVFLMWITKPKGILHCCTEELVMSVFTKQHRCVFLPWFFFFPMVICYKFNFSASWKVRLILKANTIVKCMKLNSFLAQFSCWFHWDALSSLEHCKTLGAVTFFIVGAVRALLSLTDILATTPALPAAAGLSRLPLLLLWEPNAAQLVCFLCPPCVFFWSPPLQSSVWVLATKN